MHQQVNVAIHVSKASKSVNLKKYGQKSCELQNLVASKPNRIYDIKKMVAIHIINDSFENVKLRPDTYIKQS